jgi:UDP-GlcNAc:undecaprenyl-phosphate/decaprenyl-phosphate GlcNAc-1-phosphate transferase
VENIFFVNLLSTLISLALGYPAMRLAFRSKLIDIPGSAPHKQHTHPTPLAGGLLILMTLGISSLVLNQWLTHEILIILCGSFIILFFGIWDDARGLSAYSKLIGQFIASCVLIIGGIKVNFFEGLELLRNFPQTVILLLNIGVTFLWLIGITNAMNMVDSMDGLVAGLCIVTSAFFLGATSISNQRDLMIWSAVLLGLGIGLYFWNASPAYFFLGDSGAQTLGFLLAALGILYNPVGLKQETSWFVPVMLLGVPIFDTTLVALSRIRRKQSLGDGRLDHTYHRMLALGLSPSRAVMALQITALIVNCVAFIALSLSPLWANVIFLLTILLGLIALFWLERKPTLDKDC